MKRILTFAVWALMTISPMLLTKDDVRYVLVLMVGFLALVPAVMLITAFAEEGD